MGQTLGKAKVKNEVLPFVNIPFSLVSDLRQTLYEVAEGYGITLEEIRDIVFLCLLEFLRIPATNVDACSETLFRVFNDDSTSDSNKHPSMVDSFEVVATLCLLSGMELDEKIDFLFELFDLSETGDLDVNEMTLALRTVVSGANKVLLKPSSVSLELIDRIAVEAFETLSSKTNKLNLSVALTTDDSKLSRKEFFNYIHDCLETKAFLDHFDGIRNNGCSTQAKSGEIKLVDRLECKVNDNSKRISDGPWRDQVRFLKPKEPTIAAPPQVSLSLNWVYGRNMNGPEVLYGADGSIFYPAGTIIVKLSNDRSKQQYFSQHDGHVTSIAILHSDDSFGEIVASADVGKHSKICIWSTADLSLCATIPRFHQNGVSKLIFSPSGNFLLALGNGTNTLAIYHWRTKTLVYTSMVSNADVYDCKFLGSDNRFGICDNESVQFWTRSGDSQPYIRSHGVFNRLSTKETMTCLVSINENVVTGSASGRVWLWEGRVCLKMLEALHSPITCLGVVQCRTDPAFCVSTRAGTIYILRKLTHHQTELMSKFNVDRSVVSENIDSLCCSEKLGKILIAQGSNLYETDIDQPHEQSHLILGQNKVASFVSLEHNIIATISENGELLIWDTALHKIVDRAYLELKSVRSACIAYSEALGQIAIGLAFGHETPLTSKSFIIVDRKDVKSIVYSGCNAQKSLNTCKFSSDGQFLAFGSDDFGIYIHHTCNKKFPLVAKCRGHTGPVSSIDFGISNGSTFLRSNSSSGEAMFFRAADGKSQTPMSQRQTQWESQSCALCWSSEGVHDDASVSSCCLSFEYKTLFVGDSTGILRVFNHPVSSSPLALDYKGHSRKVSNISANGRVVYSMSRDFCIFQWKCIEMNWNVEISDHAVKAPPPNMIDVITQLDDLDFNLKAKSIKVDPKPRSMPWKRAIVEPTNPTPINNELPSGTLGLEKVYGYNGKCSNNLHCITASNQLVYSVGKVLIRFDVSERKQQFYISDDKITCLALHQSASICAIANTNLVQIVDLNTMKPIQRLDMKATCMDFDRSSGRYLAVFCNGTISILDWRDQSIVDSVRTFSSNSWINFYGDSNIKCIVECRSNFIRMWTSRSDGAHIAFERVWRDDVGNDTISCITVEQDHIFVGCCSGNLLHFKAAGLQDKRIKAHESSLTCISASEEGIVAASDSFVKIWSTELRCLVSINARDVGIQHTISAITWDKKRLITVGTDAGEIWQLTSDKNSLVNESDQATLVTRSLVQGGFSMNPNNFMVTTTGDDGLLSNWNIYDYECNTLDINLPSRACAFSPDGRLIAIGVGRPEKAIVDGKWVIMNVNDPFHQVLAERRDVRRHITNIKWSQTRIAVGSSDGTIVVYDVSSNSSQASKIKVLSVIELNSPASHFDLSRDTKYLRVNTADKQLLFFEAGPGYQIQEISRLKDVTWDTNSCTYSWNTQGVWSPFENGCEITSLDCNQHNDSSSLVCGDSDGSLKLYRYPCTSNQAHYIGYSAHAGPVGFVGWLPGGSHVISTGQEDNSLMIWKHEVANESFFIDNSIQDTLQNCLLIPRHRDNIGQSIEIHHIASTAKERAELLHIQGYESNCIGKSAFYGMAGEVMYPTSNVVVNYDRKTNSQRFFTQYGTTISAICVSSSKQLVASASGKSPAGVTVWDSSTDAKIADVSLRCIGLVFFLAFSPDNSRIACISHDNDSNYTVSIVATLEQSWSGGYLHSQHLAGHQHIFFAVFNTFADRQNLVTGGPYHLNFWNEDQFGLIPSQKRVDDVHICGLSVGKSFVTGTQTGKLNAWEDEQLRQKMKGHEGNILALCGCAEGFLSAGSDGLVIMWSMGFQKLGSFEIGSSSDSQYQQALCSLDAISSITRDSTAKVLVGTRSGEIREISCITREVSAVCDGHEFGNVQAASFNPNNQSQFVTVGSDRNIKVWSFDNKSTSLRSVGSELPLQCVDWSSVETILVGCDTNAQKAVPYTFMVLNASDLSVVGTGKASEHSIIAVKVSPQGNIFACAASNFKIYIHENSVQSSYKLLSFAEKHNNIVTSVDFSVDSVHIRGISRTGECICFATETGEQSESDEIEWATNTCMHLTTENIVSQPTCSQLLKDCDILMIGMTTGCIEFKALGKNTEHRTAELFNAHYGPVKKAIINKNGEALISIGEVDRTLRVWALH